MWDKLAAIEERFLALEQEMGQPGVATDPEQMARLGRDYKELMEIIEPYRKALKVREQLEQSKLELRDASEAELRELLKADIDELEVQLEGLLGGLRELVTPKDPLDAKHCIVEIRAGAGGDEASLFAGQLLTMYMAFAQHRGWKTSLIDHQETGLKGIKEAVLEVKGRGAYGWLRYESGVHRVQRVPVTESQGRIHTSTATGAVRPEAVEVAIVVNERDLKIDTYRASGAGGQHVNKTSSAIRITHQPTGIVVTCQDQRSQLQNKEKALKVLKAKLYKAELERQQSVITADRRSQVGTGERSEKIRTYNFPDGRISDHRIGMKVHDVEGFLAGGIEGMLTELRTQEEGERLSRS
jgi:peptide chain release factor 1